MKLSWKKRKNAYGYVYAFSKNIIKSGDYMSTAFFSKAGEKGFTRKLSVTASIMVAGKQKSTTVYVAPVSKYGFIGKVKKFTVKLK